MTIERYQKVSESMKKFYRENVHHSKGKPGAKPTAEQRAKISAGVKRAADLKGRVSEEHKKARNIANVIAYRARKKNSIPPDADLTLIRKIYENCPNGYHVDHIVALAAGGAHHQDNLQYLQASENCRKGKNKHYDQSKSIPWKSVLID